MEITPRELRDVEIRESFRGYSRDDVNELLERAASTLEAANERLQQMSERLSTAQSETGHTRANAVQMPDRAETQDKRLVAAAGSEARRRGETERRRLEEEVLDFAGRRD